MFIKLVNFTKESDQCEGDVKFVMFESEHVEFKILKAKSVEELGEIFSGYSTHTVVGHLPESSDCPVKFIHIFMYDAVKDEQKTVFAFNSDLYLMNENGKTVDRLGCF